MRVEIYRSKIDGKWRWRLIGADGAILGESATRYPTRESMNQVVKLLREAHPLAAFVEIE